MTVNYIRARVHYGTSCASCQHKEFSYEAVSIKMDICSSRYGIPCTVLCYEFEEV